MNSTDIKSQLTNLMTWASSGTKLTYAAICVGLLVALILFRLFFKNFAGIFHSIGFSISSSGELGQDKTSRIKLLFALLLPPASAYAAYIFLPKWFPTIFS